VNILVVEDEQKMAKALQEGLEADGYSVRVAHTGEDGFYLIQAESFDVVILDIMLPGHDGFEILTTLRRRGIRTPVLLLTSKDTVQDRVRGLDAGADDYLVKPFAFPELLARTRALSRRGHLDASQTFKLADVEMDLSQRSVIRGGQPIELTVREFELLAFLFANQGRVVSREMLARDVWKETARQTPLDNVIDAQMMRLRRKLDGQSERKLLHTVRGVGFILRDEGDPL
jgi:two-component system, OmpR family, copper resistance phosphate regulon response regulator CusR